MDIIGIDNIKCRRNGICVWQFEVELICETFSFFNFSWFWISVAWRVINQLRSQRIFQSEDDPISYQIYLHYKSRGEVKIKVEQRTVKRPAGDLGVEQWPWGLTRTKWIWIQTWKVRKRPRNPLQREVYYAQNFIRIAPNSIYYADRRQKYKANISLM